MSDIEIIFEEDSPLEKQWFNVEGGSHLEPSNEQISIPFANEDPLLQTRGGGFKKKIVPKISEVFFRDGEAGHYSIFSIEDDTYPFLYKGKKWRTVKHFYEAHKFENEKIREDIRETPSVKDISRKISAIIRNKVSKVRKDWNKDVEVEMITEEMIGGNKPVKVEKKHRIAPLKWRVMEEANFLKFKQNPKAKEILLETKGSTIFYVSEDLYWGNGNNGEGKNSLGYLLGSVRAKIFREETLESMEREKKSGIFKQIKRGDYKEYVKGWTNIRLYDLMRTIIAFKKYLQVPKEDSLHDDDVIRSQLVYDIVRDVYECKILLKSKVRSVPERAFVKMIRDMAKEEGLTVDRDAITVIWSYISSLVEEFIKSTSTTNDLIDKLNYLHEQVVSKECNYMGFADERKNCLLSSSLNIMSKLLDYIDAEFISNLELDVAINIIIPKKITQACIDFIKEYENRLELVSNGMNEDPDWIEIERELKLPELPIVLKIVDERSEIFRDKLTSVRLAALIKFSELYNPDQDIWEEFERRVHYFA